MGLLGGLLKGLKGMKGVKAPIVKSPIVSGAQASAAKLLKDPTLFKVKGPLGPTSAAGAARADIRTRLASVKHAAMRDEMRKIAKAKKAEAAIMGGHPDLHYKIDFIKKIRQQGMKQLPTVSLPQIPAATSAPGVRAGLGKFIKGLAVKARKKIMP